MHLDKLVKIIDEEVFAKTGRHLNEAETIVLKGAWQGQTYEHIAENSRYSLATLKQSAGPQLWQTLSEALEEKVSKTNFRVVLERKGLTSEDFSPPQEGSGDSPWPTEPPVDTGEQPPEDQKGSDLSVFFGRDAELQKLISEVSDTEKDLSELINKHDGNFLALEVVVNIVAIIIREFFAGNKEEFIKHKDLVINKIIAEHFQQDTLPDLQIDIMSCLAVTSQPLSRQELPNNILFSEEVSAAELLSVIEELGKRSLIEEINEFGEKKWILHEKFEKYLIAQLLAKYLNKIGQKKYQERELNSAKSYLEMSISYNPDMAHAHYNLGSTYEKLYDMSSQEADISAARASYQKAKQYDNRAAHAAINNLARLEILAGNIAEAIEMIESILAEVNDTMVKVSLHKNLGWAYFEHGQNFYNEAKQQLQESLKLDSSYVPALCLLTKVQLALGEQEDALLSWKKCLEYDSREKPQAGVSWKLPEVDIWKLELRRVLNAKQT